MSLLKKITTKINLPIIAIAGISIATGSFLYFSEKIDLRGAADGKNISAQVASNSLATGFPAKDLPKVVSAPQANVPQMNVNLPDQTNPCDATIKVPEGKRENSTGGRIDAKLSGCLTSFYLRTIAGLSNPDRPSCYVNFKQFNGSLIGMNLYSEYCGMMSQARLLNAIVTMTIRINPNEYESLNTPAGEFLIISGPNDQRIEDTQIKSISY